MRSMCLSVCLLVTFMSCAKTAEPIEMPFASIDSLGPRNHVFHGSRSHVKGQFGGSSAHGKATGDSAAAFFAAKNQ